MEITLTFTSTGRKISTSGFREVMQTNWTVHGPFWLLIFASGSNHEIGIFLDPELHYMKPAWKSFLPFSLENKKCC